MLILPCLQYERVFIYLFIFKAAQAATVVFPFLSFPLLLSVILLTKPPHGYGSSPPEIRNKFLLEMPPLFPVLWSDLSCLRPSLLNLKHRLWASACLWGGSSHTEKEKSTPYRYEIKISEYQPAIMLSHEQSLGHWFSSHHAPKL